MLESMPAPLRTAALLTASNVFMTFAWYGHLKFKDRPLWLVIVVSWGIAFFEYCLSQLKIMQEVITLSVFVPFAFVVMKQPLKLDFLWAGLCMVGAVYFVFRSK